MSEKNEKMSARTEERYCHIIGGNTAVNRISSGNETVYECMNRHNCEKKGSCKNSRFCNCNNQN